MDELDVLSTVMSEPKQIERMELLRKQHEISQRAPDTIQFEKEFYEKVLFP